MNTKFNKKTVAQILFAAAVFLLLANIILSKFTAKKGSETAKQSINDQQVDSIFIASLHSYGIKDNWIKKVSKKKKIASPFYKVSIPRDLSLPVVLTELFSNYSQFNLKIKSTEVKANGKSLFSVLVDDKLKLKSELSYNDTIERAGGEFSFIVSDFDLKNTEDSLFLRYPEPFSILLTPSKESESLLRTLLKMNRSYVVLLNDDISELKYKLKSSYSKKRLLESISSLIKAFPMAAFFVIDDGSDIFNSQAGKIIENEFSRRSINLIKKSLFVELSGSETELLNSFGQTLKNINKEKSALFIVNSDDFRLILPEIKRFRKVGYKFVHPTEIKLDQDFL